MSNEIRLSVRSLVEYVFRKGSIDSGFKTATSLTEGTKAHQKIQKNYKEQDQKEVYLQTEMTLNDISFIIDGRCDGLLFEQDEVTIDEIESTMKDIQELTEDSHPVHWAQAKCYAYMYAKSHGFEHIHVQLTYVHVESEMQRQFKKLLTFTELDAFIQEVLQAYLPYAALKIEHEKKRQKSIRELEFPFEKYRSGQRKLAGAVYKTILDGRNLYANAPTGIGKTISTIFPSLKAIGEGLINKIFYITAKTITRQVAEESFSLLQSKGLKSNVVTITAKEKACFKDETICQKDYCEFANGYYDRINGAILDILSNETAIDRSKIEQYALKHKVCPFEFSLDLALDADAIICDYNYVFDPRVTLKRFMDDQRKQSVLLVDEAHNLVDRSRGMFSAELSKSPFLQLKREYKDVNQEVANAAKKVNDYFIALRKQQGQNTTNVLNEMPEEFKSCLEEFQKYAELELIRNGSTSQVLLDTYFETQTYLRMAKLYDSRYVTMILIGKSEVVIKLFCLDPSHLLKEMGKGFRAKVLFSATLTPIPYFRGMLGSEDDDYVLSVSSPFHPKQTEVLIQPLSTRYKDREDSYLPITKTIHDMAKNQGNYLVFFPSYQYMKDVYEKFSEGNPEGVQLLLQNPAMTEDEREDFLQSFQPNLGKSLVGFAVLGGIFSEGVDLKGDRLNGVMVVGVGLPQLCLERDVIKKYFDKKGKNGYDYAYIYPGMNKVLQAGGRLIRSEEDYGKIVLVDDRYLQPKYQSLLPEEWRHFQVDN